MRCILCLTILSLNFNWAAIVIAQEKKSSPDESPSGIRRAAQDQEKRVLHSLFQRIKLEVDDLPLKDVFQQISQMTEREILIDTHSLAEEGISVDQTVTFNMGPLTLFQAFYFLLEPLELAWVANDGVLEITTKSRADECLITQVYDVRNLCKLLEPLTKDLTRRNRVKQQAVVSGGGSLPGAAVGGFGGGGNGGVGGGYFSIPVHAVAAGVVGQFQAAAMDAETARVDFIQIGPRSVEWLLAQAIVELSSLKWVEIDGEGGSVQPGLGHLIISQTYLGHLEIAGMLHAIERQVEGDLKGNSISAGRPGYPFEEDAAIFKVLSSPQNLDIVDEELKVVLDRIEQEAQIRVVIDRKALADEGISVEQNVNLQISKLPLGIGLKKILEPWQLTYIVHEGSLIITTKTRADNMLSIRLYDISKCGKITRDDPDKGLIPVLTQVTRGKWLSKDGEGGAAALISSNHLVVYQTQDVHAEIELLIDDLKIDGPVTPVEPQLQLKVHAASDISTATDLVKVLPQLIKNWSEKGTINQAGKSLIINQPAVVHQQVEEIMLSLDDSLRRINPPANPAASVPAQDPVSKR